VDLAAAVAEVSYSLWTELKGESQPFPLILWSRGQRS
jgi:hypothetical protein